MVPWALPPCKHAINMQVARGPANMQSIGLAALDGAPSGDLEASNKLFKKASQLRSFFLGSFCPPPRWPRCPIKLQGYELATLFVAPSDFHIFCERDPRKLVVVFCVSSRWPRGPLKMQGFELAAISVAACDFQNFFEVATGLYKNVVILDGGYVLSSLFSLLPAFFHPAIGR